MIHSKSHDGFTLIEVLLSVVIMGTVLVPIFVSQGVITFSVGSFSSHYQRLISAKNYLIDARKNDWEDKKTGPKTIDFPPATLTYSQEKISGALAKTYKDVRIEKVRIEWTENNQKRVDHLVSFIFKPEKETEK